jgi:zinc protease
MNRQVRTANWGIRISFCLLAIFSASVGILAQDTIPAPGPARAVTVPTVKESKLKNGLTVAVVEKRSVPIVTVQLLVKAGASAENIKKAGLANITADMLTKGTKTRTAEQIAEEMEFLGASINTGAGWNSTSVTMSVTSDKLEQAMAIMADVVLNPSFKQAELELLKSQTLDELKASLAQPAALANYVASVYSFGEHPAGGTPDSVAALSRDDLVAFYTKHFTPESAVIIFGGDISAASATSLSAKFFEGWRGVKSDAGKVVRGQLNAPIPTRPQATTFPARILVVDLPGSGQASVSYALPVNEGRTSHDAPPGAGRVNSNYYDALVLNSVLGGGYSSRLNQEIRIKRGLSYGAGSTFGWRGYESVFSTRTQTKNPSAAEVAELVLGEVRRLGNEPITDADLGPRKSVLVGGFGRNIETTAGLVGAVADLYTFGIPTDELNRYMKSVNDVSYPRIKQFATNHLMSGDIIIVGDYSIFKDDLAKRFPNMKIDVIKADEVDIESPTLRKSDVQ